MNRTTRYCGEAIEALRGLARGMAETLIHLFRRKITEEYPEYKRPLPARSRARIVLTEIRTEKSGAWLAFSARLYAR